MARRKTDQVYATLQQVQRRITEAAAGADLVDDVAPPPPEPVPGREPQGVAHYPLTPSVGNGARSSSVVGAPRAPGLGATALSAPVPQPTPASGPVKIALQLSSELASFLVVLWLVTLAIAFFVGRSQAPRAIDPGADYASGPAGHRDPEAARAAAAAKAEKKPAAGSNVLVLMSTRTVSPTEEQRFANRAEELNAIALKAGPPYKPWFAVRKSREGSLQLVWGSVDGKLGVDNNEWDKFRVEMEAADPDNFKGAYWLSLGDAK